MWRRRALFTSLRVDGFKSLRVVDLFICLFVEGIQRLKDSRIQRLRLKYSPWAAACFGEWFSLLAFGVGGSMETGSSMVGRVLVVETGEDK
jgi:hypothetical protein